MILAVGVLAGALTPTPSAAQSDHQSALGAQSSQGVNVYAENASHTTGVNPIVPGETMIVEGRTNLDPDQNVIIVELFENRGESVRLATTDAWGQDGLWRVRLNTSGLSLGPYVLEIGAGEIDNVVQIELVANRTSPTETAVQQTVTPVTTTTPLSTPSPSGPVESPSPSPTPSESGGTERPTPTQPGFGALVAVTVLIGVTLLPRAQ